jgi:hypothetical protein
MYHREAENTVTTNPKYKYYPLMGTIKYWLFLPVYGEPRYLSRYNDRLDGLSSVPGRCNKLFSSPQRQYRLRGPISFLTNEYRGIPPWEYSGREVKLIIHFHLVMRSLHLHPQTCSGLPLPYLHTSGTITFKQQGDIIKT